MAARNSGPEHRVRECPATPASPAGRAAIGGGERALVPRRVLVPPLVQRLGKASPCELCEPCDGPWLDLGSGAGFPGLIIAAMRPDLSVVLVESRRRRIDWLEGAIGNLGLYNCRVEGQRLENVTPFEARIISARAFAPLDRLLTLSAPFSTSSTHWVLPKGRSAAHEVAGLPKNRRAMFHVEQSVTDPEAGIVVGRGEWSAKA